MPLELKDCQIITLMSPPSPKGRSGTIVFHSVVCSFVCSFVRLFDTFCFLDSHSRTKPHRILLFGTMIDPNKTLFGVGCLSTSWIPIFDLVITYFVSSFLNGTSQIVLNPANYNRGGALVEGDRVSVNNFFYICIEISKWKIIGTYMLCKQHEYPNIHI